MNKSQISELIGRGNFPEASIMIAQYEHTYGLDEEICSMNAAIAVYEGKLNEAEQWIKRGIAINPDFVDLIYNMGYVQQQLNKPSVALRHYERAAKKSDNDDVKALINDRIKECEELLAQTPAPLVSIVVLAYNKIDYTKMCIESIYKYTSHIDFEFITVNNASSDETEDYFDALPDNARPIHLAQNRGVVGGFNAGIEAARGQYTACVCNDFIFTPRWLDNLLTCIESDPTIGYVSPGASYISNYQQINGKYNNIGEMLEFAEQYNHSDPRKWEQRMRLMPCVLMVRTRLLQEIGGYDPAFYYGEFADDDISFRIRRAGYKLVFCRDTFTYHFGSVTVRQDQVENNSMQVSRNIFKEKYNLDSWADAGYNPDLLGALSMTLSQTSTNILGIHTKCGSNPLQLMNMLKERSVQEVRITNYCMDERFYTDLVTVSDHVVTGALSELKKKLHGTSWEYVILELTEQEWSNWPDQVAHLSECLSTGGQLALSLNFAGPDQERMRQIARFIADNGFQVHHSASMKNIIAGYDLLITARKGV